MKRKGCISILFIITVFICFSFIRIGFKEEPKWSPPVSNLTWGMSFEEVEKSMILFARK